jgi:hypothetical protein
MSPETAVLSLICLADMFSTLIMVSLGYAVEKNPLMAACLRHSLTTFVLFKTASFLPFIIAVEWYRRRKPIFARNAARAAIILYVITYVILTVRVNMV